MKITHPDSKQTLEVDEKRAEAYLSQGWVEKSKAESGDKPPAK